jgi:hypothetical protein
MNELDFSDIYGSGTGNLQGTQDIMKFFFDILQESKREHWQDTDWMGSNQFGGIGQSRGYDLQGWEDYLSGDHWADSEKGQKQADDLLSMLQGSGIMDLTKKYRQNIGDVGAEFASKVEGHKKGYSTSGKSDRYSKVGTGGRDVQGGGRSKYMSDIYGLQQEEQQIHQNLQDEFTSDFYGNIARWQGINPSPFNTEN